MKLKKIAPRKHTAQAMVEFAIVLPVLLLLLYGVLEAGRLLFMYSTIVTASRQAARYGSATGEGLTTTLPRYQDCDGIRAAANRADFLNAFVHTGPDVVIQYDDGPGLGIKDTCDGPTDPLVTPTGNETRIVVTVTGHFRPLVRLVPFGDRPIIATSNRTILVSVPIEVTVPSSGTVADTTETQLLNTSPNPSEPGQPVTISVSVSNTSGTAVPEGAVAVSDGTTVLCTISVNAGSGGAGTCTYSFYSDTNLTATFTPLDPAAFQASASNPPYFHDTTMVTTVVTITHTPYETVRGENVHIVVTVTNLYGGTTVPTGDVAINVCGTIGLSSGTVSCDVVLNNDITITADYPGDTVHLPSNGSSFHHVMDGTATPSNTPLPTSTPTETPIPSATPEMTSTPTPTPTVTSTASPTPVIGCNSLQDDIPHAIAFHQNTMYLDIDNANPYPVTVSTVFVAWHHLEGGSGKRTLTLNSAQLNTTTFWSGSITAQSLTMGVPEFPFIAPVVIPPNQVSRLTFTFNRVYANPLGEEITLTFSTPGCTFVQVP
jgi:hypothetical protein